MTFQGHEMKRTNSLAWFATAALLIALVATATGPPTTPLATEAAQAAKPSKRAKNVPYRGLSDQELGVKLIANRRGAVQRGRLAAETTCSGQYEPFDAKLSFPAPLDRSGPLGFRDVGSFLDADSTYSGRYKYVISGERKGRKKIAGEFDLEVVFRKDGRKYTTCEAEGISYLVKRGRGDRAERAATVG